MSSLGIGAVVLVILFASSVVAMMVGRLMPEHHLSNETRTTVSVTMAIVGTMSALVVSLLISNASSSYSARNA
jgi:CDP-diglyceride synthetase